jgi:GNAT superfamily N-acetyltransferase
MLVFTPIFQYKLGDLSKMIRRSYSKLVKNYPRYWKQEEKKWDDFDKQAFEVPEIGRRLFISCLNGQPIGLASYDPRNFPEYGVIGQNCILPEYQGKDYGRQQIREVLRIFRAHGVKKAKVTTSEHPFFKSARNMYE